MTSIFERSSGSGKWSSCSAITIEAGEDLSSPDVTVPNPLWGMDSDPLLMEILGQSKNKTKTKTVKKKRLHTNLAFVIRKLSGVVALLVTKTDYQKLVGKKHVKNKRKHSEMEFSFGMFDVSDPEEDDQPTWSIPGIEKIHTRGKLASTALEIEDVVADEAQNMLTISFKQPMRAFAQTSQSKDGEITFEEVAPGKTGDSQALGQELVGMLPMTMKMKLFFEGDWNDQDVLGDDGEGKTCFTELKTYLSELQEISKGVDKKRALVADLQKRRDEQKGTKFADLAPDSYARKAVKEFSLDIMDTGCWDQSVLEEEWKLWYEMRQKAESETIADGEYEEGEEEEEDFEDEEDFESSRFRQKMLLNLRDDYEKALKEAGLSSTKAEAAAKGLYVTDLNIVEDDGIAPRTCTVLVRIFSAVGKARVVDLKHEHHARARMSFHEEHSYINAKISAFDPESASFRVVEDLQGSSDSFSIFGMECDDRTGACKYSLASAKQVQKLVAAIFGKKCLSDRDAFRVFMMASGADAHPFTEMNYDDFCPLTYLDAKLKK